MAELVYAKNLAWEHLHRLEDPFYAKTEVKAAVTAYEAKMVRVGRGISNLQNWYRSKTKNGSILRSQIITELESGKSFYVHSRNDQPVRPLLVWNDQLASADNNSPSINANKGSWVVREGVNPQLASVLSTLIKKIEPPKPVVLRQSTKSSLPAAVSPATKANKDYDLQYQVLDRSGSPVVDVPYVMKMADGTSVEGVTESDGCTQVSPSLGASEPVKLYLADDCLRICKAPILHNDCEYGLVTTKKMTPRSSLAPIEVKVSVLETFEVADIMFATGMNKFYLLTEEDVKELEEEEKIFIDISQRLQDAINQDGSDPKLISGNSRSNEGALLTPLKQTKAEIVDELSQTHGLSVSGGPGKLIEQRRVLGKKHYTYIRSDKMKNHWRSYDIENKQYKDDRAEWITDGKLDEEKFNKKFKEILKDKNLAVKFKEDLWNADLGPGNPMFDTLNSLYHQVGAGISKERVDETGFDASSQAQFFRFAAGAAVTGELNPKNGVVAFDSKAEASFDMAKGKAETSISLPANNYSEIQIPYNVKEDGGLVKKSLSLGHFQATLKLAANGHVGASAMLGANLSIDCSDGTPKFKSKGQGASGQVELFAGVKAGGSITGELKWADSLSSSNDWKVLCQIGKSVNLAFGAGLSGELTIKYSEKSGKFVMRVHAGLVVGPGAEGSFVLEVSARAIIQMIHFVYDAIRSSDFHRVEIFSDANDFKKLVNFYLFFVANGIKMQSNVFDSGVEVLGRVEKFLKEIDAEHNRSQEGMRIAPNLIEDIDQGELSWVRHSPPEVKGILLYILMADSNIIPDFIEGFEERKLAAFKIIQTMQSTRDYQETIARINKNGEKSNSNKNARKLFEFLERDRGEFERMLIRRSYVLSGPVRLDPFEVCAVCQMA